MTESSLFTIDYHRTRAGGIKPKEANDDGSNKDKHPISRKGSILLGKKAGGCDWNDFVVLPNAKTVDITNQEIVFAYRAYDTDKNIYVKNLSVMVRNIIFKANLSYTLIYKELEGYEVEVNTFTITQAYNSQGKFIELSLSAEARKDIIASALDISEKRIRDRVYPSDNIEKFSYSHTPKPQLEEAVGSSMMAG